MISAIVDALIDAAVARHVQTKLAGQFAHLLVGTDRAFFQVALARGLATRSGMFASTTTSYAWPLSARERQERLAGSS